MKSTKTEKLFWIANVILVIIAFFSENPVYSIIKMLIFCIPINPFILNQIRKKIDGNRFDFWNLLKFMLPFLLVIVVIFACYYPYILIVRSVDDLCENIEDLESLIKIAMYLIYLVMLLYVYRDGDKKPKYLIFGAFYTFCTVGSFFSTSIGNMMASFVNMILKSNYSLEIYNILYLSILTPIKEAILTYIIFEVIFEEKPDHNEKKADKNFDTKSDVIKKRRIKEFLVNVLDKDTSNTKTYRIVVDSNKSQNLNV